MNRISSLALGLVVLACQSSPSTSSSSNWVVCEVIADCAAVPGATACVDGYCVDEAGARVEVPSDGSGGSASGGDSGSGGAVTTGGAAASGGAVASGGEPMNLGGQGATAGSGGAETELTCADGASCAASEICILATTVVGPTETEEFVCVSNPCGDEVVSCECAAPACERPDGRGRLCFVPAASVLYLDLFCQDQAQ